MKKILLISLCFVISLTFISCDKKNNNATKEGSSTVPNTIFSPIPSRTETTSQNSAVLEYKGKKVKELKFNSSLAVKINFTADDLKDLENAENDETIPEAKLLTNLGTIKIFYDDGTSEDIGTVYHASDNSLYLKFNNSQNKYAAHRISKNVI